MKRDLHFEMTYAHAPEHVWKALITSAAMAQWLMPNNFLPVLGHRFQFHTKPAPGFDGIVQCEVLEIVPLQRLVYTWVGGGIDTKLTWTLEQVVGGTKVTLDHTGFEGLRGMFVSGILNKGWRSRILSIHLPALLDRWSGTGPVPSAADAPPE
ncbi:MAG: SRPBCC domain-containing protein [Burkholderiaceae bacterium]|jgi:uncharacterized protein YndB with AHSA1/START domain